MEKSFKSRNDKIIRIVVTGPECTGKTTLVQQLSAHYKTDFIPEYAREFVENLCRPYTYEDILHIAEIQQKQFYESVNRKTNMIFFDTYLIITKIWLEVVFGRHPQWIDKELAMNKVDLYLLCDTSIPWIADSVRENGGEMREKLFEMYKNELDIFNCRYALITGTGQPRFENAVAAIDKYFMQGFPK